MQKKICLVLVFILIASWLYPQSITNIDPQEQQQKQKDLQFQLWQEKLDKAEKDKKNAQRALGIGIATTVVGTICIIFPFKADVTYENEDLMWGLFFGGIGIAGVGTVIMILGAVRNSRAGKKIDELMKEGEKKGFLTYSYNPATQTVYIGYKVIF